MRFYKNLKRFRGCVQRYISKNGIKCRYAGWIGMAGDVDLVRVDGRTRRFDMRTDKEVNGDG